MSYFHYDKMGEFLLAPNRRRTVKRYRFASDHDLPEIIWSGTFDVFGIKLTCHVLSDGRRVIEQESVGDMLLAMSALTVDEQEEVDSCA